MGLLFLLYKERRMNNCLMRLSLFYSISIGGIYLILLYKGYFLLLTK